jgi:hypothetical protein
MIDIAKAMRLIMLLYPFNEEKELTTGPQDSDLIALVSK